LKGWKRERAGEREKDRAVEAVDLKRLFMLKRRARDNPPLDLYSVTDVRASRGGGSVIGPGIREEGLGGVELWARSGLGRARTSLLPGGRVKLLYNHDR
jgi:hypothetical protein